jgi:uncharacterized protein (DUF2141 family)
MKTSILFITLLISSFVLHAQSETYSTTTGTSITVTIPVNTDEGKIILGLYTEDNFRQTPVVGLEVEIVEGKATAIFNNITPGEYAIVLFHDKNENKQMDFHLNGMPKEMYGTSNNVMNFGPPQWSDAKFEVANTPISLEIRM